MNRSFIKPFLSFHRAMSRGQVVYPATPDSTAVVKGSSTSDVLLLLKTELMMVTEVEDEG
jgi:hypothetical protein